MANALALLTIEIGINPEIREIGDLLLTWHGVFTAVAIAAGVFMAVVMSRRLGITEDDAYSAALVAIPCGIIGARALFVVERWGSSGLDDWVDIFRLNEGGISIYGAVLGGFAGGLVYGWVRKLPLWRALDGASIALVLGLAVGRIGDIINGEHYAKVSDLPWAVQYTHLNSPSVLSPDSPCSLDPLLGLDTSQLCAQHPAVAYEMIGDLLIFGLLLLVLRLVRREGVVFFGFLLLYSLLRFGVSELRVDSREIIAGLSTPQVTALFLIPFSIAGLIYSWRREAPETEPAGATLAPATGPPAR